MKTLLFSLATSWLLLACSHSAGPANICAVGDSLACKGEGDCAGHEACASDGSGFGACLCDRDGGAEDASAGVPTDSGLDGRAPFLEFGPTSGRLGARCKADTDCRQPLTCVATSSTAFGGEGPPGGLCTLDCSQDVTTCAVVDSAAVCVAATAGGTVAFCQPGCQLGNPEPREDKCRNRADTTCVPLKANPGFGYCFPTCRNDGDCATRHCNLGTGLCADTAPAGSAVGASCDPAHSLCAGLCVAVDPTSGTFECSGLCALDTVGCGETATKPPYDNFCLLQTSTPAGVSDVGLCAKLCDCDADCGRPDTICTPHPSTKTLTGRAGYCASRVASDGGLAVGLMCEGTRDE